MNEEIQEVFKSFDKVIVSHTSESQLVYENCTKVKKRENNEKAHIQLPGKPMLTLGSYLVQLCEIS